MTDTAQNFLSVSAKIETNLFLSLVSKEKSPVQAVYPSKPLNVFTRFFGGRKRGDIGFPCEWGGRNVREEREKKCWILIPSYPTLNPED